MVSYLALLQTNLHGHQQKNLAPESSDGFAVYIFSPTAPSLSLKGDGLLPALEMQRIHRREGRAGEGYEGDEDSVSKGVWCGGVVLSGGIQKEWLCIVLSSPHLWI